MRTFKNSRFAVSVMVILFAVSFSSCSIHTGTSRSSYKAKKLPPGQAKKYMAGKALNNMPPDTIKINTNKKDLLKSGTGLFVCYKKRRTYS